MQDCIFCKIVNKESPAVIDYQDDDVIAFKNIKPVADTHILIVPKEHVTDFLALEENDIIAKMTKVAQDLVNKNNIQDGYKLIFNGGKYQAIPHLHWHLLGGKINNENDI